MSASKPQADWTGQTVNNRYELESQLGRGGMSTVYKANDPNLRRTVAVKLIHPHLSQDPEFVRRFEHEAAAVAQLRHANIIQVYDFNHENENYYMVMEYVPGEDLKDRLKALSETQQRMPLDEAIRIMSTICEAVAYAHEHGMIHRDLKPANVMLTPKGQPILMDFGVAKMLDGVDHTATGTIIGTAKYLSPEQAKGERPDERSDIYSLGVMLYEMVTGRPPYDADTTVAILMKHVNEPLPDIRQVQPNVPDDLARVIEKALAKNKQDRYQTASQMAVALRAVDLYAKDAPAGESARKTVTSFRLQDAEPNREKTDESLQRSAAAPAPATASKSSSSNPLPLLIGGGAVALLLIIGIIAFLVFSLGASSDDPSEAQAIAGPDGSGAELAAAASEETSETIEEVSAPVEDPNLPSSNGMTQIAGATYSVGVDTPDRDHAATQQVDLDSFWIDQYEITNAQYAEFLADTGSPAPDDWSDGKFPEGQNQYPVQGVTWELAANYCEWANKRLPTEAEWEVAARGPEGRLFPWGDNLRAVTLPRSGTYEVGGKPTNQSPFGVFDMAGNVWEWVSQPYAPVSEEGFQVLRGGANDFLKDMAYRLQGDPTIPTMVASAGFRCAADEVNVANTQASLGENVLLEDSFGDPGSGWPILAEGTFLFGYHPPDYYHIEVSTPEDYTAVTRPPNFENITMIADVQVDHTISEDGDFRYGLALRRVSEDEYYAFTVSSRSNNWAVLKSSADGLEVLDEGLVDSLQGFAPAGFTPSASDQLRVDAIGANFVFYINDVPVTKFADSDYTSGEAGFFVENFDETLSHIHYDSLEIRRAEALPEVEIEEQIEIEGLLYQDDFTDPASGWPEEDIEGEAYKLGYHPPDFYHVEVRAPNDNITVSQAESFSDVTVQSDLFVDFTDTEEGDFRYGLLLRRAAEDQYYAFTVSSRTGTWYVLKQTPTGLEVLAEGPVDTLTGFAPPGFSPSTTDSLRVDANGPDFVFHINDEPVIRVNDADYESGEVGFYVETFDETLAHVHYGTLIVREVEEIANFDEIPLAAPPAPTAPEGMVAVPAGTFLMGANDGEPIEGPEHEVSVDGFYIDTFEVSNAEYRECVEAGACEPVPVAITNRPNYGENPEFDNYPAVNVPWDQAVAYCEWAGKRLPTEAEWEYAASGPENLVYPWGNEFEATFSAALEPDLQPVDRYPEGRSPFGAYQMAGNAGEWVLDVFDEDFYGANAESGAVVENPLSEGSGQQRIYRGGTWGSTDTRFYRTSFRFLEDRPLGKEWNGFRCVQEME